jgi:propane monooxygenase reductase subunit
VRYSTFALPDYEKEEGYALLCRAYPMEDLVVELLHYDEATLHMTSPIRTYEARVEEIEPLTHDISRLALRLVEPREIAFRSGQYVDIRIPGASASRSFSILRGRAARAIVAAHRFPLHTCPVGAVAGGRLAG